MGRTGDVSEGSRKHRFGSKLPMPRSGQAVFHNIALPVDETLEFDQYVVFGASLVHEWNMFDTEIDQTKNWQLTRIASLEKISGKEGRIATIRQEA